MIIHNLLLNIITHHNSKPRLSSKNEGKTIVKNQNKPFNNDATSKQNKEFSKKSHKKEELNKNGIINFFKNKFAKKSDKPKIGKQKPCIDIKEHNLRKVSSNIDIEPKLTTNTNQNFYTTYKESSIADGLKETSLLSEEIFPLDDSLRIKCDIHNPDKNNSLQNQFSFEESNENIIKPPDTYENIVERISKGLFNFYIVSNGKKKMSYEMSLDDKKELLVISEHLCDLFLKYEKDENLLEEPTKELHEEDKIKCIKLMIKTKNNSNIFIKYIAINSSFNPLKAIDKNENKKANSDSCSENSELIYHSCDSHFEEP
ncbi:hypothetical protein H311_03362 [Anncaliia algerae PRA109]|nr:hypothetical protein H311_03362 [Anncaliia algerae PRA109]